MNKKALFALLVLGCVLLFSGSVFLYNKLSGSLPKGPVATAPPSADDGGVDKGGETETPKTPALDFTVVDGDSNEVKLSDFFGKPLVVNFWASWCGPCKEEMPDFNTVYEEMGEEVTFMMVNLTGGRETRESAEKYVAQKGFSFPVYFDIDQNAAATYAVRSIPMSLFIDKDGYIVAWAKGMIDEETLRDAIDMIVEKDGEKTAE